MADSDFKEWIKSYNQKKDEIKKTQLYTQVYDFIKESFKSGELFDQEIAKRKFIQKQKEKNNKCDKSDLALCFQTAIEQLEREHFISNYGTHHTYFPIYRVNSAEYIKEKQEEERVEAEEWELYYGRKPAEWEEPLVSDEELDRLRQTVQEGNEH